MTMLTADIPARADVPVAETWDLRSYYVDEDAWAADLERARGLVEQAAAYRGRLAESAEHLKAGLDATYSAREVIERLIVYASSRRDEDLSDSARSAAYERAVALAIESGEKLAFIQPELVQISPERFADLASDPALEPYRHVLDEIARNRPHTRSVEVEELLAASSDVARTAREAFGALDNADLSFGSVVEDGTEIALTKGRMQLLLERKDRELRRRAFETFYAEYQAHINTLASLFSSSLRKDAFYARARNFGSARESALFDDQIPEAVYDSLVQAVSEAQPVIRRYLDLRAGVLEIDDLALYDLYVPMAPQPERTYTIAEAVETVLKGVAPLGEAYVADLRQLFDARVVDWHETRGKDSGAYSNSAYGANPIILMNWNGSTDHVFTLAHEAGHAMHSFYANRAQPYHDAHYSLFIAEIASTVNEVLLTWELLDTIPADEPAERFALLNRFADGMWGTLFRQTMFADFEQQAHAAAEMGQPLTPESLGAMYEAVADIYRPGVANGGISQAEWSRIPHFYRAFYVFQYSTGISAAIAFAKRIKEMGQPAREAYLAMLAGGGSDYPITLIQQAGVDLTSPEPVKAAIQVFDETVAEMARIAAKLGLLTARQLAD